MKFSQKEIDEFIEFTSENLYQTSMTVWFMALNTAFGFGKKRFARLKEAFDKHTRDVMDFDYLGVRAAKKAGGISEWEEGI